MSPYVAPGVNRQQLNVTSDEVLEAVCKVCAINKSALLSHYRKTHVVIARQVAQYLIRKHVKEKRAKRSMPMSWANIAAIFDQDHTTVMHNCQTVFDQPYRYSETVENVTNLLNNISWKK